MRAALPLGAYVVRVVVPLAGVLLAVFLLVLAAGSILLDLGSDDLRQGLFAGGVLSWMFGIGWGVMVNAKPVPAHAEP